MDIISISSHLEGECFEGLVRNLEKKTGIHIHRSYILIRRKTSVIDSRRAMLAPLILGPKQPLFLAVCSGVGSMEFPGSLNRWYHIIPQLAVYTTYISPIPPIKGTV